jgi:N-acetylglutamate synthase-like GNAT family acetyltransferase
MNQAASKMPLARTRVSIYSFRVHNHSSSAANLSFAQRPGLAGAHEPVVRPAARADVEQIYDLVKGYVAEGLMLPRSPEQIALNIESYVVAAKAGRVVACAALEEYSPSLAEVSCVAVARDEHGNGLGTQVVLGVERLARARDIDEIFALSLTDNFFLSLEYAPTAIARYPEKLSRYENLATAGVEVVPKRCFQKTFGNSWQLPQLVETSAQKPARALRAS